MRALARFGVTVVESRGGSSTTRRPSRATERTRCRCTTARVRIADMAIMDYQGFTRRALVAIVAKLTASKADLQEAWNEIHDEG